MAQASRGLAVLTLGGDAANLGRVLRMASPGHFPSEFSACFEKFLADSEQTAQAAFFISNAVHRNSCFGWQKQEHISLGLSQPCTKLNKRDSDVDVHPSGQGVGSVVKVMGQFSE